jgi:DNA-binding transcriptional LysR family regulator
MQLESLAVFCDVARHRSFSLAAAAHHVSQSAASQIVSQLEKRLGGRLINRSTRPLQLTALGQAYYEGCRELLDRFRELEASIRQAQSHLAATVQVAAIYSVGLGDLGQRVARFTGCHPHADIRIEYLHPDRVYEKVLEGTADIGMVSFPRKTRELTVLPWRDEEMVLACPPRHPLAGQATIRLVELTDVKYVGFDRGLVIRREVDRFLREHGVAVAVALEFDNIESIKKAIEDGAGVALLPAPTLQREVQMGALVTLPLAGCRLVRPLGIMHRRQYAPSATAAGFIDMLRQENEAASESLPDGGRFASGNGRRPRANGTHRGRNGATRPAH